MFSYSFLRIANTEFIITFVSTGLSGFPPFNLAVCSRCHALFCFFFFFFNKMSLKII